MTIDQRLVRDVTQEYEQMRAQLLLLRVMLKLNPGHDVLWAVRSLLEEGKETFEKKRGPACDHAHEWAPRSYAA